MRIESLKMMNLHKTLTISRLKPSYADCSVNQNSILALIRYNTIPCNKISFNE